MIFKPLTNTADVTSNVLEINQGFGLGVGNVVLGDNCSLPSSTLSSQISFDFTVCGTAIPGKNNHKISTCNTHSCIVTQEDRSALAAVSLIFDINSHSKTAAFINVTNNTVTKGGDVAKRSYERVRGLWTGKQGYRRGLSRRERQLWCSR